MDGEYYVVSVLTYPLNGNYEIGYYETDIQRYLEHQDELERLNETVNRVKNR